MSPLKLALSAAFINLSVLAFTAQAQTQSEQPAGMHATSQSAPMHATSQSTPMHATSQSTPMVSEAAPHKPMPVPMSDKEIKKQYHQQKERCKRIKDDDLKNVCKTEAEAAYQQNKAAAKESKKVNKAREERTETENKQMHEVREAKLKAKLNAAKEKCDKLSGDAKSACDAQAEADYNLHK